MKARARVQDGKPAEQHRRDTPFVCKIKFHNNLPDLPCDPKMLTARLDTHKLSQFKLTQLELALRPDLVSEMDPGSLSLIDAQRYCQDSESRELDPADRAIIEGNKGKSRSSVTWLMKTKYMQARDVTAAAPKTTPSRAANTPQLTIEEAQQAIEESFEAAREPPVHPRKPQLKAREVMPVLPNTDCWSHTYVTAMSPGEFLNILDIEKSTEAERTELVSHCILKAYDLRAPPWSSVRQPVHCNRRCEHAHRADRT